MADTLRLGCRHGHSPTPVKTREREPVPPSSIVGVMTVDDQAVFRRVAREVIEATAGFQHLGEATSGEEALALADELRPDLVLLDVCMPGIGGVETARRISASYPAATIVLISTAKVEDVAPGFASCGASAFIRKEHFGPAALRRLWSEHGDPSKRTAAG